MKAMTNTNLDKEMCKPPTQHQTGVINTQSTILPWKPIISRTSSIFHCQEESWDTAIEVLGLGLQHYNTTAL